MSSGYFIICAHVFLYMLPTVHTIFPQVFLPRNYHCILLFTVHILSLGVYRAAPCYVLDLPRMGIEVTLILSVLCVSCGRQCVERSVAGLRSVCSLCTMCVIRISQLPFLPKSVVYIMFLFRKSRFPKSIYTYNTVFESLLSIISPTCIYR